MISFDEEPWQISGKLDLSATSTLDSIKHTVTMPYHTTTIITLVDTPYVHVHVVCTIIAIDQYLYVYMHKLHLPHFLLPWAILLFHHLLVLLLLQFLKLRLLFHYTSSYHQSRAGVPLDLYQLSVQQRYQQEYY